MNYSIKKWWYELLNVMHNLLYGRSWKPNVFEQKDFAGSSQAQPDRYKSNITRLKYRNKFLDK